MQIHATNSKEGTQCPRMQGAGYEAARPLQSTLSSFGKYREEPSDAHYLGLRHRGQGPRPISLSKLSRQ